MRVFTYFRSSAAWRVRIALALKGVPWTPEFVHLLRDGGEQLCPAYRAMNPTALVPTLETDGGAVLIQSLALIEWLEEAYPTPPLLPAEPLVRARVRGFALTIACEIHPLNNLRVLRYLMREMDQPDAARDRWYAHWIGDGLTALEAMLGGQPGPFCFGEAPGLADVCLVPQLANARRFNCPLDGYPALLAPRRPHSPARNSATPRPRNSRTRADPALGALARRDVSGWAHRNQNQ